MLLSDPLIEKIEIHCVTDKDYSDAYNKIRTKIEKYAESIKLPLNKLLFNHVIDNQGNLSKKFLKYLNSLPIKKRKNSKREKNYPREIFCTLKRVIYKELFNTEPEATIEPTNNRKKPPVSLLEKQCPPWMKPLRIALARVSNLTGYLSPKGKDRLNYPLTDTSAALLCAILKTTENLPLNSMNDISMNYTHIVKELRVIYFGKKFTYLQKDLLRLWKKLGFSISKPQIKSMSLEDLPSKMKAQWENFVTVTNIDGIENNPFLVQTAPQFGVTLKNLTQATIESYESNLLRGLFKCSPPKTNWGVENFLSLKVRKIELGGIEHSELYNEHVDKYLQLDREEFSESKRKGFTSVSFINFLTALKSIAAANGIFGFHQSFTKAYPQRLDRGSCKLKKDKKKQLFPISEVDKQILAVEPMFQQLVKAKAFERRPCSSIRASDQAMRLCILFPMFVALRYLGLRQRNIRNFRIMSEPENPNFPDGNIGFRNDHTLVIHFEKTETKNCKAIHHEFGKESSEKMCGILIRTLKTYIENVYPYIKANAAQPLNSQLFAYKSSKHKGFMPFLNDGQKLRVKFETWTKEFFTFEKISTENDKKLHPHFLRGLCTDWLLDICGFSIDEAAVYLADDPKTLEEEYRDRNRIHNATKIINQKCKQMNNVSDEDWKERFFSLTTDLKRQNDMINEKYLATEIELKTRIAEIEGLKLQILMQQDVKREDHAAPD